VAFSILLGCNNMSTLLIAEKPVLGDCFPSSGLKAKCLSEPFNVLSLIVFKSRVY